MKPDWSITLESESAPADMQVVSEGLRQYNLRFAPPDGYLPLNVFVRAADGRVLGWLLGNTYWGWLFVSTLWFEDSLRGQDLGTQVLRMAEDEARRRGCSSVHLDTLSFQALPFYQKQGYTIFGVLEDLPPGHRRYFLQKGLER